MGRIYQNASRVLIDVSEHQEVMATSDLSGHKWAPESDFVLDLLESNPDERRVDLMTGFTVRDAVNHFFRRAWFHRTWVLQEVYRARRADVLCGTWEASWSIFKPFKIWHRPYEERDWWHPTLPEGSTPPVMTIGNHQNTKYTSRKDLFTLLRKVRLCKASDPCDKVFALLLILSDKREEVLSADYTKCPVQIFSEIAAWLLSSHGLTVLSCISSKREPEICGLPSWVPSWSVADRDEHAIGLGMGHPLKAGGDTEPVVGVVLAPPVSDSECAFDHHGQHCLHTPRMLRVRGIALDTIRSTSIISDGTAEQKIPKNFVSEVSRYRAEIAPNLSKGRWTRSRMPRTNEDRLHPPHCAAWKYGLPFQWEDEESDNDVIDKYSNFCANRLLMLTEGGYFGLVLWFAEAGDTVCIFLGGAVPFVIRKPQDYLPGDPVKFVRECYVYWMMEGEAFAGIDLSASSQLHLPQPLEDFYII